MLGTLKKMRVELDSPVHYRLELAGQGQPMNELLGHTISLRHTGRIFCVHCQRPIKKTYNQGYCYPCFVSLAQCDLCILKPQTCHYHLGTCREPAFGQDFCFKPHIVYLANASGIKVGITRQSQVPTRWIDQGAAQALPVFMAASRHVSGLVEVLLAEQVGDKTHWRQMLKKPAEPLPLAQVRDTLLERCGQGLAAIRRQVGDAALAVLADGQPQAIQFPVLRYPAKITSRCLAKTPVVEGVLQGIKGQYLLLDTGVINIRKYTGFEVEFSHRG